MIADFCDRLGCLPLEAVARAPSRSASVSPAPKAPIWRKSRRAMPSQNRWEEPRKRNMIDLAQTGGVAGGTRRETGALSGRVPDDPVVGWDSIDWVCRHS